MTSWRDRRSRNVAEPQSHRVADSQQRNLPCDFPVSNNAITAVMTTHLDHIAVAVLLRPLGFNPRLGCFDLTLVGGGHQHDQLLLRRPLVVVQLGSLGDLLGIGV